MYYFELVKLIPVNVCKCYKDDKMFLPTCIYNLHLKFFQVLVIRLTDPQFPFIFLITKQKMNKTKPMRFIQ